MNSFLCSLNPTILEFHIILRFIFNHEYECAVSVGRGMCVYMCVQVCTCVYMLVEAQG